MTAAAQPVPDFTSMALKAQFMAHAPHSMQLSLSVISALPLFIENTSWGHTFRHIPHPTHFSRFNVKLTTFFKYLCFISNLHKSTTCSLFFNSPCISTFSEIPSRPMINQYKSNYHIILPAHLKSNWLSLKERQTSSLL